MPVAVSYPGVYVQELPSSVHTIVGVPTSVAAFVGGAARGPVDDATQITSWPQFVRTFGGLDTAFPMTWSVFLFFQNGGAVAQVVRAGAGGVPATIDAGGLDLEASSPGVWGQQLRVTVDADRLTDDQKKTLFNLTVVELGPDGSVATREVFPAVPFDGVGTALRRSTLVQVPAAATALKAPPKPGTYPATGAAAGDGGGGGGGGAAPAAAAAADPAVNADAVLGSGAEGRGGGIFALAKADIFNMLILPTATDNTYAAGDLDAAVSFCEKMRAVLIVDPPQPWGDEDPLTFETVTGTPALGSPSSYAAVYYPNLTVRDDAGALVTIGPSGAVAGVWAATDASRGVWKAPAGTQAGISGITKLAAAVDDAESGTLNPVAVNALRTLPLFGPVVWGARTTVGADARADQWKYLPVRRTALFIEESLRRASQWVVFEPNDEPLWASLRLNFGAFMNNLWRQGAFQGTTPADAYLVKCDKDINPQNQIDLGIVNILVGFAPLKPAEFVIISIQQLAGQLQT
jgi:phage tail sheath protein FI